MLAHRRVTVVLLHVLFLTTWCSAQNTYYVKPTSDTPCPATPCLTLLEYARVSDQYFAPNTTMVFLPGNHSVGTSFFIVNLTSFEMHGDRALLPDVNTRIICTEPALFHFNNISTFRVSAFIACGTDIPNTGALDIEDVQDFRLIDCSLEDSLYASALAASNVDLSIVRTSFINNSATNAGGGISAYNSNVYLKDSEFTLNHAFFGGAVYAENSNVSVNGSKFLYNQAGGIGGGLFFSSSSVVFNGSTHFIGNSGGQGGGIIAHLGSIVFCGETTFTSNYALTNGGTGLPLVGGAVLALHTFLSFDGNTTVWSNLAVDGGGGLYAVNTSLSFKGKNDFSDNLSSRFGGGITLHACILHLSGTTLIAGNTAVQGGGLYIEFSDLLLEGTSTFVNNTAEDLGTAVVLGGGLAAVNSSVNITGRHTFTNNLAEEGGGISVQKCVISLNGDITFKSNYAIFGGGMVVGNSSLDIGGIVSFIDNSASSGGGGLFAANSYLDFVGNSTFFNNSAPYGGGIYLTTFNTLHQSYMVINGASSFINNHAYSLEHGAGLGGGLFGVDSYVEFIGNTTFFDNSASSGGGIYITTFNPLLQSNVVISGASSFINNHAHDSSGGAIRMIDSIIQMSGSTTCVTNSAAFGGAIAFLLVKEDIGASVTITGRSTFISNSARGSGGALSVLEGSLILNGDTTFMGNSADVLGGGIYAHRSTVDITGDGTFHNNSANISGGAIGTSESNITINGNAIFSNNFAEHGGALSSQFRKENVGVATVIITGRSTFISNSARGLGGALYIVGSSLILNGDTAFMKNSADGVGGGVLALRSTIAITGDETFHNNSANLSGGAIHAGDCNVTIIGNATFQYNLADSGGALSFVGQELHSSGTISGSLSFVRNSATYLGGAMFISNGTFLSISGNTTFLYNSAQSGSCAILSQSSKVNLNGTVDFFNNTAFVTGAIVSISSHLTCQGNTTFRNNTGSSIDAAFSNISFSGITTFSGSTLYTGPISPVIGSIDSVELDIQASGLKVSVCNFSSNGITYFIGNSGPGLVAFQSDVESNGINWFVDNMAINGGGILSFDSTISLNGNTTIVNNIVMSQGGGLYALRSNVNVFGMTIISNNSAGNFGGGIHAVASIVSLSGEASFLNNAANLGGALSLAFSSSWYILGITKTYFDTNIATRGGAIHVADTVDSFGCTHNPDLQLFTTGDCFFQLFNPDNPEAQPDTTFFFQDNTAKETGAILYGGLLDRCVFIDLLLLRNVSTKNDPVALFKSISNISDNSDNESTISSDPMRICFCQNNLPNCTFEITELSVRRGEAFAVSALAVDQVGSPVPATIRSYLPSQTGENADLGEGVDIQQSKETCTDLTFRVFSPDSVEELVLYADGPCRDLGASRRSINVTFLPCPVGFELSYSKSECICEERLQRFTNTCDIDDESFRRNSDFWVTYHKETPTGLILHPHCPFDYCQTAEVSVRFDDLDTQCAYYRSGFLCGRCKDGLSLPFGSSRCLPCSNVYISITIAFIVAGILLVALLLLCQLTVVDGDLNGLILYANVVAVNKAIFFPSGETNILTVFIAWVNLDLGIETCFYDGMDAYARSWLQFAFPVYMWILVGLIIAVSHYSTGIIVRILGRNPVAVLATLFLLSYAKMLRTIITALSFTSLEYPDESLVPVWLFDGNIGYLSGKHIPLFVAALVALFFLFLPYTLFLLVGHWLQAWSQMRIFSWANHRMLKPFMDAYHAPYQLKHRYWTGLLLLLRCVLFLTFAFNDLGEASINLLAIASASLGLIVVTRLTGSIYKKWYIEALESSFILNLGILAVATYHVRLAGGNQTAVAYISVGIAFSTFIGILFYHVIQQLKDTKCVKTFLLKLKAGSHKPQTAAGTPWPAVQDSGDVPITPAVSTTMIELRESMLEEQCH